MSYESGLPGSHCLRPSAAPAALSAPRSTLGRQNR